MINPSEITEGGVVYSLGKVRGDQVLYEFPKILVYLEAKGKLLFGDHFRLFQEDKEILFKLSNYFIKEYNKCRQFGLDPEKGILLTGPVGCGKTSLMRLFKYLVPHQREYEIISCRNIVFSCNHLGSKTIEDYGNSGFLCFDDLGIESDGRYYGSNCNVMGEILLSRHELFLKHKFRTHLTSNLNSDELEERYGIRVRSRMREMFNLVSFDKGADDKRK